MKISMKIRNCLLFILFSKLLSESIKQEQFEDNSVKQKKIKSKTNHIQPPTGKKFSNRKNNIIIFFI